MLGDRARTVKERVGLSGAVVDIVRVCRQGAVQYVCVAFVDRVQTEAGEIRFGFAKLGDLIFGVGRDQYTKLIAGQAFAEILCQ